MKEIPKEIENGIRKAIPPATVRVSRPEGEGAPTAGSPVADFVVSLELNGIRLDLRGDWVRTASTAAVKTSIARLQEAHEASPGMFPMLMAPYFTERQRQRLVDAGVAFVDLAGNAHIAVGGVYISTVAPRVPAPEPGAPNPFSDKASLVARKLLVDRGPVGILELASRIGVTPGYVSKVVSKLETLGYLSRVGEQGVVLRDSRSLLDDWAVLYDFTRSPSTGYFCRSRSAVDIIERFKGARVEGTYGLTTQAGAYLVAPHSAFDRVDVYSADTATSEQLISLLKLERVDKGANVFLLSPYYKHSVFFGSRKVEGVSVVSDLQLYLDLFKYPLRGREQAEHLYEARLRALVEPDV
jgi:hypothetical protein